MTTRPGCGCCPAPRPGCRSACEAKCYRVIPAADRERVSRDSPCPPRGCSRSKIPSSRSSPLRCQPAWRPAALTRYPVLSLASLTSAPNGARAAVSTQVRDLSNRAKDLLEGAPAARHAPYCQSLILSTRTNTRAKTTKQRNARGSRSRVHSHYVVPTLPETKPCTTKRKTKPCMN
jgi:hypothetical protein